jgi:hypothetical protein
MRKHEFQECRRETSRQIGQRQAFGVPFRARFATTTTQIRT